MNQTFVILRIYKYIMRVEVVRRTAGTPTGASAPSRLTYYCENASALSPRRGVYAIIYINAQGAGRDNPQPQR